MSSSTTSSIATPQGSTLAESARGGRGRNALLWSVQVLLAGLFLFAGGMKLVMPIAELTKQMPLPGWFLRGIGVLEVLGALGLVLPGLFRFRPSLTPLAAMGLAILMVGAVGVTIAGPQAATAPFPVIVGLFALGVAYGRARDVIRWSFAPEARVVAVR